MFSCGLKPNNSVHIPTLFTVLDLTISCQAISKVFTIKKPTVFSCGLKLLLLLYVRITVPKVVGLVGGVGVVCPNFFSGH